MNAKRSVQGFTLIELMIAVAVVGILAAIALPAYNSQMRKSRRADAQATLMNVAARQQQTLLDTRAYAANLAALGVAVPASVTPFYTVTVAVGAGAAPSFTATATPQGGQALDSCGTLTIDQNGVKAPANCW
jgi:type IV pilus assembly protein PilE